MKARILLLPLALLFILAFTQCAKRGRPTGGAKDTIPPKPLRINPKNLQTNFSGNKVTILFDEYIRLDKLQENLIISPPMEKTPTITPYNVSKTLEIEIADSLAPNTTYTFNFGNSIVDNNEGNILEQFEYVFSTGDYIDSLELRGKVIDSRLLNLKKKTGVNLYKLDETFHDSIITKGKPNYVSVTDEEGNFRFTNLANGKYLLVAIQKEKDGNPYIYNAAEDKFAFHSTPITIPNDSIYNLYLYRERGGYYLSRPEMVNENLVRFGYRTDDNLPNIELENIPENVDTRITKEVGKDTLYFWYHPSIETDSLHFNISYKDSVQLSKIKIKEDIKPKPFKLNKIDIQTPNDTLKFRLDTPLDEVNENYISLVDEDSISVPFKTSVDRLHSIFSLSFDKEYRSNYYIQFLPGAIIDWQGETNDTIHTSVRTKSESEYGSLHLNIQGINDFPVKVDLLDSDSKLVKTDYLNEERQINFMHLSKGTYYVRLSYDINENGKWDSGNFSTRTQPEPVFFFYTPIEVHANWSVNETFRVP